MLIAEAKWFRDKISGLDPIRIFPMLNIGSSTDKFRLKDQPWVDEYIFRPLKDKGRRVVNADIKDAPGVDLVGDLTNTQFAKKLSSMGFKSILASNLLEHVIERNKIASELASIIPSGGYLFVSNPYRYPYHPDPIDTMFRPGVSELASLFPGTKIISSEIVVCGTYGSYLLRRPLNIIKIIFRIMLPFYRPKGWITVASHIPWLSRHFETTCLVLQKE